MKDTTHQWIDGKASTSRSGQWMVVEDPATGQVFAKVPRSNGEDVKDAVAAARRAFEKWSQLSERERESILLRSTVLLRQQLSTLSEWEVRDC